MSDNYRFYMDDPYFLTVKALKFSKNCDFDGSYGKMSHKEVAQATNNLNVPEKERGSSRIGALVSPKGKIYIDNENNGEHAWMAEDIVRKNPRIRKTLKTLTKGEKKRIRFHESEAEKHFSRKNFDETYKHNQAALKIKERKSPLQQLFNNHWARVSANNKSLTFETHTPEGDKTAHNFAKNIKQHKDFKHVFYDRPHDKNNSSGKVGFHDFLQHGYDKTKYEPKYASIIREFHKEDNNIKAAPPELKKFSKKQKLQGYPVFDRQTLIENVAGAGRDLLGFSDDVDEAKGYYTKQEDSRIKRMRSLAMQASKKAAVHNTIANHDAAAQRHKQAAEYSTKGNQVAKHYKWAKYHEGMKENFTQDDIDDSTPIAIQRQHTNAAQQRGRQRMGSGRQGQTKVIHSTHATQLRVKGPKSGGGRIKMPPIGYDRVDFMIPIKTPQGIKFVHDSDIDHAARFIKEGGVIKEKSPIRAEAISARMSAHREGKSASQRLSSSQKHYPHDERNNYRRFGEDLKWGQREKRSALANEAKAKPRKKRTPINDIPDDDFYNGTTNFKRTDDVVWHNDRAEWPAQMMQTAVAYDSGLDARTANVDMNFSRPTEDPRHTGAPMQKSQRGGKKQQIKKSVTSTDDYIAKNFDRLAGQANALASKELQSEGVNW